MNNNKNNMNAKKLYIEGGKEARLYYCSICKTIHKREQDADGCCKKNLCVYCNEEVEKKGFLAHKVCSEKNMYDKAEKLEKWDGWVYYEGCGNQEFFENIKELLEFLREEEELGEIINYPEYVYICKEVPFPSVDVENIYEHIYNNSYEGILECLENKEDLEEAIKEFNEANMKNVSYVPDYTKMVRINYENIKVV